MVHVWLIVKNFNLSNECYLKNLKSAWVKYIIIEIESAGKEPPEKCINKKCDTK